MKQNLSSSGNIWAPTVATRGWRCRASWLLVFAIVFPVKSFEVIDVLDEMLNIDEAALTACRFEPDIPSARVELDPSCDKEMEISTENLQIFKLTSFDVKPIYKLDADEICQSYLNITWSVEYIESATEISSTKDSSSEMNEDASSQTDEDLSSEMNEDLEGNANVTSDDYTNDVDQRNLLTFRLNTLGQNKHMGMNFCITFIMSSTEIVNRSITFNCLRLKNEIYSFILSLEKTLEDDRVETLNSIDYENVKIQTINGCELPESPGPQLNVTPLPPPPLTSPITTYAPSNNVVIVVVSVVAFLLTLVIVGVIVLKIYQERIKQTIPPSGESRSLVSDSSLETAQAENPCSQCANVHGGNVTIVPPATFGGDQMTV